MEECRAGRKQRSALATSNVAVSAEQNTKILSLVTMAVGCTADVSEQLAG